MKKGSILSFCQGGRVLDPISSPRLSSARVKQLMSDALEEISPRLELQEAEELIALLQRKGVL